MHTGHHVKQIAPHIWKITRYQTVPEERESLFIREPADPFEAQEGYACACDPNGLYHFYLHGKDVFRELSSPYTQSFSIGEKDGIYGLGIHQEKPFNRRGTVLQMLQRNSLVTAVPFLVSTGGYAVLFDTCAMRERMISLYR